MKKALLYLIISGCFLILFACSNTGNITQVSTTPDSNPGKIQLQQATPINVDVTENPIVASSPEVMNTINPESTACYASPTPAKSNDEKYKDKWGQLAEKVNGITLSSAYSYIYQLDGAVSKEPDPVSFLCDGMKQQNFVIRWYCASKIIEYYNKPDIKNAIEPLNNLLKDPAILASASLSLAIINRTYDNEYLVKSHRGNRYLFTKYYGSRYNDGKLWLIDNGKIRCITKSISIGSFGWSPDDKWLYTSTYNRISSFTTIVNVKSEKVYDISLFEYICDNSNKLGYKVGKNQRPDPGIKFLEWSPDSSKILLSYLFFDDNSTGQKGIAVYNIEKQSIEKITPLGPFEGDHEVVDKPADFKWN